jgi:hypothetical protein
MGVVMLGNQSLSQAHYALISVIEGLKLHAESAERLERNASLSLEARRAVTIRAFVATRKCGESLPVYEQRALLTTIDKFLAAAQDG